MLLQWIKRMGMSFKSIAYVEVRNADTLSGKMLMLVKSPVIHDNQAVIVFSVLAWQLLRPQGKSYERFQM